MTDEAHAQQLRSDATALLRTGEIAAFFAAIAAQGDDEAGAEQARHDENTLKRWAQFLPTLAE